MTDRLSEKMGGFIRALICLLILLPVSRPALAGTEEDPSAGPTVRQEQAPPKTDQKNDRNGQAAKKEKKKYKPHIIVIPTVSYSPETSLALGAGGNINYRFGNDKESARPSTLWASGEYTFHNQYEFSLKPEFYLMHNSFVLTAFIQQKRFPQTFYGVGNSLPISSSGESYTPESTKIQLGVRKRFWKALYIGVQYEAENTANKDVVSGGLLETSGLTGLNGGLVSGFGLTVVWDDRDNIFFPSRGKYIIFSTNTYSKLVGSDYTFSNFNLDVRAYYPAFHDQVVAIQFFYNGLTGTVPFYRLAMLGGGSIMRGYYTGLYRDKNLMAFQAEYRMPLTNRFGVVGFASVGKVADRISDLNLTDLKLSGGAGLRYKFDVQEKANIRLDFAWGHGTHGMYLTAQEAF